jgi:type I restriction enzyme S subunit
MKQGWEVVKLGEVLKLNLDSVDVNSMSDFPFAGVYSFGKGLFKRGNQSGSETSYKTFNRLHKNQIIVSKVKGWEGAIAKVEEDFEGLFLSPICPTFDLISEQKADIHFIDWFLKQEFVWQKLFADSKGIGARRNSISEKQFLNLEIPLPPLSEQQRIAGRLAALKGKIDAVRVLRGEQEKEMKGLLLMQYQKIIEGAEWKGVIPI